MDDRADVVDMLDALMRSSDPLNRVEAVERGCVTDTLVADPDDRVRAAVARRGEHLDVLAADPSPEVRYGAAYGTTDGSLLEYLSADRSALVRMGVAAAGGIWAKGLRDDPDPLVRHAAESALADPRCCEGCCESAYIGRFCAVKNRHTSPHDRCDAWRA